MMCDGRSRLLARTRTSRHARFSAALGGEADINQRCHRKLTTLLVCVPSTRDRNKAGHGVEALMAAHTSSRSCG